MTDRPKACVNQGCNNTFYVPAYKLHMMLQCPTCSDNSMKMAYDPPATSLRAVYGVKENSHARTS